MARKIVRTETAGTAHNADGILDIQTDMHRSVIDAAARDICLAGFTLYGVMMWLVTPMWLPAATAAVSGLSLFIMAAVLRRAGKPGARAKVVRSGLEYALALIPLFAIAYLVVPQLTGESRLLLLFVLATAAALAIMSARHLPKAPRMLAAACGIALIGVCAVMSGLDMWVAGVGLILMTCLMAGVAESNSSDLAERLRNGVRGMDAETSLQDYEDQARDRLFRLDADGNLQGVTHRFAEMAARKVEQLENAPFVDLFQHGKARVDLVAHLSGTQRFSSLVLPIDIRGQKQLWSVSARPTGDGNGMRGVVSDVTAEQYAEARISRLAHFDPVTDLPNRLTLEKEAGAPLSSATPEQPCALMFVDVDHFKAVNDDLGHRAGDVVLRTIADRLRRIVPEQAMVARLGGDEFAVLLPNASDSRALADLAQRLVDGIAMPISHDGRSVRTSISIGVARTDERVRALSDLLHHADLALYAAKEKGRNRHQLYDRSMGASERQRRALVAEMEIALQKNQFQLYFQPLVDARTQEVRGFESLLRWIHPDRGFISPAEFIPAAEESGFIQKLGIWVIETAVKEAAKWPGNLTVAVNVSPIQLASDGLEHIVAEALRKAGLQPPRLELEITEGVLLQESKRIRALLERIRALGVRFSLDDFGTGYSSLSYLRTFLFHKIKVDRSFVIDMQSDKNCRAIIKTVISLARDMGMTTVAEGIELPGQLAALQALGCDQIQGYLTGRPMPAKDVHKLLGIEVAPEYHARLNRR
ncbi:MAG: EAL domain-containing protein [Pacificimonas sp.]